MNEIINTWIRNQRLNGRSWDWIRTIGDRTEEGIRNFLRERFEIDFWELLTLEEWRQLVDEQEHQNEIIDRINDESGATIIGNTNEDNEIIIPPNEDSAWQCYKNRLRNNGFGLQTIAAIERSTIKILKHLSRDTTAIGPIKGLVVGNVQSGKTANMAALMAMAADNGWNMFVILSGIIDSLRVQTQRRLTTDLNNQGSLFNWQPINYDRAAADYGNRVEDFNLNADSNQRYFAVCLKNAYVLKRLLGWLARGGQHREQIKMLIIDDEADQASINANPRTRTRINNLILNLVNNRNENGAVVQNSFQAVNYIGYTATPYANVLNEQPGENSLYPSNFIATLAVSDEYFGPQQIFGCSITDYLGLNIIRDIPDDQIVDIQMIHNNQSTNIPEKLKDAVCWFLCGVSCIRYWGYSKPVSMMIHTSINTNHHSAIANSITQWINDTNRETIIESCRTIWVNEADLFNVNSFREQYPNYHSNNDGENISSLPTFDHILRGINYLLDIGITNIQINDNNDLEYTNGIHLCIDNSVRNNNPAIMRRLLYPDANNMPDVAPAFIVVGGQTLSRGLTIEGLISTFFLRSTINSDTLMQMGRWFGYRRGYELLPRIWMSARAREQFEFISEMDYSLRQEIKQMADTGTNFSEVGPRIITSPQAGLIRIVSSNRMRGAIPVDFDFSGRTMETGVFTNDQNMLAQNLHTAREFIKSLGNPSDMKHINGHNYLWTNIEFEKIRDNFINQYQYSERLRGFNDLSPLISWLEQYTDAGLIENWNVILAGKQNGDNRWEATDGISVIKVDHTQRGQRRGNIINIGVLRSPNDFLTDIPIDNEREIREDINNHRLANINDLRSRYGLDRTPQLIIYVINRNSTPRQGAQNRFPLDALDDIIGFCINIPGIRNHNNGILAVRINIPQNRIDI